MKLCLMIGSVVAAFLMDPLFGTFAVITLVLVVLESMTERN